MDSSNRVAFQPMKIGSSIFAIENPIKTGLSMAARDHTLKQ
jgi:hypothetical protein